MDTFLNNINYIIDDTITENILNEFIEILNKLFIEKNINEYFLNHTYVFKSELSLHLMSKKNLDIYLSTIDSSFKNQVPTWITGITTDTGVYMVLSLNVNMKENAILALHEIIHFLSKQLNLSNNNERYLFLEEALSTYICSQMTSGKFSKIIEDYNNNSLKTIKSLLKSNENESFAENNGYYYSFFFMKFLKNNYYKGKIFEYIKDSKKLFNDLPELEKEFNKFIINQIEYYNK